MKKKTKKEYKWEEKCINGIIVKKIIDNMFK